MQYNRDVILPQLNVSRVNTALVNSLDLHVRNLIRVSAIRVPMEFPETLVEICRNKINLYCLLSFLVIGGGKKGEKNSDSVV